MLRTFFVVLEREDDYVAGTLGDMEYLVRADETSGYPTCIITTDNALELIDRLNKDDNVLSFEEDKPNKQFP